MGERRAFAYWPVGGFDYPLRCGSIEGARAASAVFSPSAQAPPNLAGRRVYRDLLRSDACEMLQRLTPALRTVAVTLVLLTVIGAAGVVDHTLKARHMNRAELSEWYCEHNQTRCGGESSSRLEDAWNKRERGYQLALVVVAAAGGFLTIVSRRQRANTAISGDPAA